MRRELLGEGHADTAWSLYNLAYILINRGKYDEAELYINEALAKRGANLPDEHPAVSSCLLSLGRIKMAQGLYPKALAAFEECLALRKKSLSPGHWLLASTYSFIGECLIYLGETEAGSKLLFSNYETLKDKIGAGHEQTRLAKARIEECMKFLKARQG